MIELLAARIPSLVVLWLSLSVHEWAHARAAYALGDQTAAAQGRLTLDPLAHLDPLGTVLLPLFGVPFGWATPVPVNPAAFDRRLPMSLGLLLTAVAGPVSNLALAAVAAALALAAPPELAAHPTPAAALQLLRSAVTLNVVLAVFNLFPIPPLDGSRVVAHFLPRPLLGAWEALERRGALLPFAVLVLLTVLGLNPLVWLVEHLDGRLLTAWWWLWGGAG